MFFALLLSISFAGPDLDTKKMGNYIVGKPLVETNDSIVKSFVQICHDEGCDDIPIAFIQNNGVPIASLEFSHKNGVSTISEINVVSPLYTTKNGLGPGMKASEFYDICDAVFWYSYISGIFVLECPTIPSVQFLLPASAFTGDSSKLGMTEMDILKKSDLNLSSRVTHVRIF